MRTFAEKHLVTRQPIAARTPLFGRPHLGYNREVNAILRQQCNSGYRAAQQPLHGGSDLPGPCVHSPGNPTPVQSMIFAAPGAVGRGSLGENRDPVSEAEPGQVGIGQDAAGPTVDAVPAQAAAPETTEAPASPTAPASPAAAAAPAAPLAITSKSTVHAPDGTPDTRTKIAVCETIEFSLGGQTVNWAANSGWPSARNGQATFSWAAPEVARTATITATDPASSNTFSIDMTVVAPALINMRRNSVLGWYPAGTAGAGMTLGLRLAPRDVNFGWLAIKEDPGPASNVSGYFAGIQSGGNLNHVPNANFERLTWNNTQIDTAATVPNTLPGPWSAGTWDWRIPTRYGYFNSPGTGHVFATTVQRFRINAAGGVTVSKQCPGGSSASVSRNP